MHFNAPPTQPILPQVSTPITEPRLLSAPKAEDPMVEATVNNSPGDARPVQLVRHNHARVRRATILFIFSDLWMCHFTEISMRCRTDFRATCSSSIYVIWALQFPSVFLDIDLYFFSSTPVVSGGASVDSDRPLPGDTTRCLLFHRYRGGYYTGNTPPFIPVFALFIFRLLQTANRRPRPPDSYIIPLRSDSSSEYSSSVVNGLFFVVSFADSLFLA